MGCYNKTCGFSNLPILHGEPVYIFSMHKTLYSVGCYTTSLYTPALAIFEGRYDDYGGAEDCSGVWLPYLLSSIQDKLIDKPETFTVEDFFSLSHDNKLVIDSPFFEGDALYTSGGKDTVRFTLMRKDLVDNLLSKYRFGHWWNDWDEHPSYGQICEKIPDYVAQVFDRIDSVQQVGTKNSDSVLQLFRITDSLLEGSDIPGIGFFLRKLSGEPDHCTYFREKSILESQIVEYWDKFDPEEREEIRAKFELLVRDLFKSLAIDHMMTGIRKSWLPGTHEGSQEGSSYEDYRPYSLLCEAISERVKEMKQMGEED